METQIPLYSLYSTILISHFYCNTQIHSTKPHGLHSLLHCLLLLMLSFVPLFFLALPSACIFFHFSTPLSLGETLPAFLFFPLSFPFFFSSLPLSRPGCPVTFFSLLRSEYWITLTYGITKRGFSITH